jgi:gamma-glutamyl-gamma-aminobutyrate hydrolase PuuD
MPSLFQHKVKVMRDSHLEFPQLWLDVFIAGDKYEEAAFSEMFIRARCKKVLEPEKADLVVFTGGPDVNPIIYGEVAHPSTNYNSKRDDTDIKLYQLCLDNGIPMLGICRGFQFIHVMRGGKLYQHVGDHVGDHPIWDVKNSCRIEKTSSVHHQMVIADPKLDMEILADHVGSGPRWCNNKDHVDGTRPDVEAAFYRDICALGIQGHPEYRGYTQFQKWSLDMIETCIAHSPDITTKSKHLRIKPELIAEREEKWARELMDEPLSAVN